MNPNPIPCEIEYVSGMVTSNTKAGMAVGSARRSMREICWVIRKPTAISAGAVAAAGTIPAIGAANMASRNSPATITECSPVRAPSATPAADSM